MSNPPKHLLSTIKRHRKMIADPWRTPLLEEAIRRVVKPGTSVLDLGCGIGILSFFAAKAGANPIYAMDCDAPAVQAARYFSEQMGVKKIRFFTGLSYAQNLPHKVDLLVCEIVGSLAFDENFLPTLLDAKKRFLKAGGSIIPERLELWGALVKRREQALTNWKALAVPTAALLSDAQCLLGINTQSARSPRLHIKTHWKTRATGILGGIALWPRIVWGEDLVTDASPFSPLTHWKQGYLPLSPQKIAAGERIQSELIIEPDPQAPKQRSEILWRVI